MYVGRLVAVGRTPQGTGAAMYRVSSRSFPNRMSVINPQTHSVSIVPKPGFESDLSRNPYIAYNCLRQANGMAIVSNGSQTDPVTEKIAAGVPPRDALAGVMLAMDYEHDSLDTPRITGVVTPDGAHGWLAIVRKDALLVREFALNPGEAYYVCTYDRNDPGAAQREPDFTAADAAGACDFILGGGVFAEFEKPVSAACAVWHEAGGFEVSIK